MSGNENFEPKIIAFLCNWCSYAGADLAGVSRDQYPPNILNIKVMCSSRVSPEQVFKSLKGGADGVLIAGCHPGDCHYIDGNYKTIRKTNLMWRMLKDMGIDPDRLRLEWISSAEGGKFAQVMEEMTEEIRELGPLEFDGHSEEE
ncbi:MAG: hydrogenase iron-sulfur subunit [Candidatus Thermoplasmatota archaeon]|nr:hydrogenase iron-sulfur subunit [Candidatus Thermoplasmatota archaeon]MBS3790437.1 hydrogenase iron-sulfur subunit [Candidatus Thermoplasmatota archaeon]